MEYIAFALKYRPKSFDEVIGQESIVTSLRTAILRKHIHHAYIFSGPRGVGKTTIARIFAKSLNCFQGPTVKPCEKCTSCLEINRATPVDVIEIDGASNRGIDEIRVLRENVKLSPTYSRFKIYIIDEVHMLSQDAFNALLKTLEEPPPHVKFLFATTHPQKVLPTILSRCQRFQFTLLSLEKIVEKLKKIVSQEGLKVEDSLLYAVSRAAEGSIRDAESLLDQLVPVILEKGSIEDIFSFLGVIDESILVELLSAVAKLDLTASLSVIDKVVKSGKDLGTFLNGFISYFRNVLLIKLAPQSFKQILDVSLQTKEFMREISTSIHTSGVLQILDLLIEAKELSVRLNTVRIPFELALVKFLYKDEDASQSSDSKVKYTSQQAEQKNQSSIAQLSDNLDSELKDFDAKTADPIDMDVECGSQPQVNDDLVVVEVKAKWQEIIFYMQRKRAAIASHLSLAQPLSSVGNIVTIAFSKKDYFHKETVESAKNIKFIEEIFFKFLNKQTVVKFILSDEITPQNPSVSNSPNTKADEDKGSAATQHDEFVNDILDTFGGNIHTDD